MTPVHAFNLEVHEVDLRGARTRFLLDSLETTLCAVRTMRTGSRPRPTRRRTNKINWRRRRPLRLLTAGSRRCGLSRFLPQSLGGGSGGGRSPGRKSCVVVRYQIEPCARVKGGWRLYKRGRGFCARLRAAQGSRRTHNRCGAVNMNYSSGARVCVAPRGLAARAAKARSAKFESGHA